MIVFLDYGHGKPGSGCSAPGFDEATDSLDVGQLARNAIIGSGWPVNVIESRPDCLSTPPLSDRGEAARDAGADLVISLHTDSSPDPREYGPIAFSMPGAGQIERIVCASWLACLARPGLAYDEHGRPHVIPIASAGQHAVASPDHKNWRHRAFLVLQHHTTIPCVLFEQGRCTNTIELEWLVSSSGRVTRAEAIRSAVCAALLSRGEIGD